MDAGRNAGGGGAALGQERQRARKLDAGDDRAIIERRDAQSQHARACAEVAYPAGMYGQRAHDEVGEQDRIGREARARSRLDHAHAAAQDRVDGFAQTASFGSIGFMTRPLASLGTKNVDFWGMTSPASATALTCATGVGFMRKTACAPPAPARASSSAAWVSFK